MASRFYSVDMLRGLAVALMILVNNPGSWSTVYPVLLHAPWHGLQLADTVFPAFLFVVGVSVVLSLRGGKAADAPKPALLWGSAKRGALLIGIGLLLNAFPHFDTDTLRYPGVLQRIGIVFTITAWAYLFLGFRQRLALALFIVLGYWLVLYTVPVPGTGSTGMAQADNLPAWLDRQLMAGHLWAQSRTWDPEGLLSTVPALATGLFGTLAAELMLENRQPVRKLALFAMLCMACGLLCSVWVPLNKALWSSSFVLVTAGISCALLALSVELFDVRGVRAGTLPFIVLGANPLFAYVGSEFLARLLSVVRIQGGSLSAHLHGLFRHVAEPYAASLAMAMVTVAVWMCLCYLLWRRKIWIKL